MNILIAYYSRGESVEGAALAIKKELEGRGHSVDVEKIKPQKEHNFWAWQLIGVFKGYCEIETPLIKDVSKYDAILIGSPNWLRLSAPAAEYVKKISGLRHKNIFLFATTLIPPKIEWYLISAYLVDLTSSVAVSLAGGRVIKRILFSNIFKRWSPQSDYGRKLINYFCIKIEQFSFSFKDYTLQQKEIDENRLVIVTGSLFTGLALAAQAILSLMGIQIIRWDKLLIFLAASSFVYFLIITTLRRKATVFLGKYIASSFLVFAWTLLVIFFKPNIEWIIIWGYVLSLVAIFFFRDAKTTLFSGLLIVVFYTYLVFNYPLEGVLFPEVDFPLILSCILIISFVARSLQNNFLELLEAQEETEEARLTLEVKISARTRELKELADGLENKVEERTQELRNKIGELEKFNKLAVGRELKMVELKEELRALRKELKK